jgi:hypothetical protein
MRVSVKSFPDPAATNASATSTYSVQIALFDASPGVARTSVAVWMVVMIRVSFSELALGRRAQFSQQLDHRAAFGLRQAMGGA